MISWYKPISILALVIAILLCALYFYNSNRAPDDAFISLRYANHLAGGEGFHYNRGGERVEGFSSPLHVMLMSSAIALGASATHVSQFYSIFGAVLCVVLIAWWGQKRLGFWWGTLAALALACNPSLGYWSRGGLETTLFTALVTGTMIAAAEDKWKTMGFLAGLLAMTRPEGPIYWVALLLFILLRHRSNLKMFLVPGVVLISTWLPWFLFRILYFHDIVPNTYYAKMDGVRSALIKRGLVYVEGFMSRSEILIPMVLIGLGISATLWAHRSKRVTVPDWPLAAGCLACASLGFAVLAGGDHMNHARFLIPAIPLIMVLAAWSGAQLASLVPSTTGRIITGSVLSLVFLSQSVRIVSHDLRHPVYPLDRPIGLVEPLSDLSTPMFLRLGYRLKEVLPADSVIAVDPAGAIPFASELTTIDMHGLNDRQMAKRKGVALGHDRPGHGKGSGKMVLERKPDYILMRHSLNEDPLVVSEPGQYDLKSKPIREIWADETFHRDYEPIIIRLSETESYSIYRRRSLLP
jgi:hypothetical protein